MSVGTSRRLARSDAGPSDIHHAAAWLCWSKTRPAHLNVLTTFYDHSLSDRQQVVKVIWQRAASPPHKNGSMVFARWRQCASHLIHPSLGPLRSIPSGISIGSAVFAELTRQGVHILYNGPPFPPQNYPFPWVDSHLKHGSFLGPTRVHAQPKRYT